MKIIDTQISEYRRSVLETLDTLNIVIGSLLESCEKGSNPVIFLKRKDSKGEMFTEKYSLESLLVLRKGILRLKFITPNKYIHYMNANNGLIEAVAEYLNTGIERKHHIHTSDIHRNYIMKRNFMHIYLLPYLDRLQGREGNILYSW